ncbi:hypothetical protein BS78_02G241100 [Paspalum vaginatum]|nr:hypothetical protein BS78_02G241100 [Paspalum vaginatum]
MRPWRAGEPLCTATADYWNSPAFAASRFDLSTCRTVPASTARPCASADGCRHCCKRQEHGGRCCGVEVQGHQGRRERVEGQEPAVAPAGRRAVGTSALASVLQPRWLEEGRHPSLPNPIRRLPTVRRSGAFLWRGYPQPPSSPISSGLGCCGGWGRIHGGGW